MEGSLGSCPQDLSPPGCLCAERHLHGTSSLHAAARHGQPLGHAVAQLSARNAVCRQSDAWEGAAAAGLLRWSQAGFAGRAVSPGAPGASLAPQPCSLPWCPGGARMLHVHPQPRATRSQSVSGRTESLREWISQLKADFLGSEDISAFIQGHPFSIKSRHGLNKWAAEIKVFFFSFFFFKSLKRCIERRVLWVLFPLAW